MIHTPFALKKFLTSIGLSDKEAIVYIALLSLGKSGVSPISREAGINRTTGYDILNTLISQGLVNISGKEPKQEYVAESPDAIVAMLQKKITDTKNQIIAAKTIIPELKSIHRVGDRPQVRFFEGKEGLVRAYEDTLESREDIRAYATVDDMHTALPDYFPKYYKRRAKKKIGIRAIIPSTAMGKERAEKDSLERRETALIPPDQYYFSPEINIYDNKIMIASWREKLGIIIESAEIADAMKKIFELSWAEARRLDKRKKTSG